MTISPSVVLKCPVTEVDPAVAIPSLERSQQIEQDPPHGAGSSCLSSHTASELCQRQRRERNRARMCCRSQISPQKPGGKLPGSQGSEEIPPIHESLAPSLCVEVPPQSNPHPTATLSIKIFIKPQHSWKQPRVHLLRSSRTDGHFSRDRHTLRVSLCMVSRASPAGQLLLVPLTAGNQGAKNPSGSSKLGKEAGGEVPPPHSGYPRTLCTPLSSGGMEVTSVHPSKELIQELIQPPGKWPQEEPGSRAGVGGAGCIPGIMGPFPAIPPCPPAAPAAERSCCEKPSCHH